jgi:hypothetical protein
MRHYNSEEWSAYVEGQLSTEAQIEYEVHLYSCEACLLLYMDCVITPDVEPIANAAKISYLEETWIEQIMDRIEAQKQPHQTLFKPVRKTALLRKPIFQYSVAAAITLLLMTTGIFHGITGGMGQSPSAAKQILEASYTDQLMDRTVAMLDAIQLKAKLIEKGGQNHE